MSALREEARKAAQRHALPDDYNDRYLPSRIADAADAASDVWEPIVHVLRDHRPGYDGSRWCEAGDGAWPCARWTEASEAISE